MSTIETPAFSPSEDSAPALEEQATLDATAEDDPAGTTLPAYLTAEEAFEKLMMLEYELRNEADKAQLDVIQ